MMKALILSCFYKVTGYKLFSIHSLFDILRAHTVESITMGICPDPFGRHREKGVFKNDLFSFFSALKKIVALLVSCVEEN